MTSRGKINIRLATRADAGPISALVSALSREFITPDYSNEGAANLLERMTPEATLGFMKDGFRYHIAEEAGKLVGYVATCHDSHLYHLFVAKSHQGRGLSRRLWETAKAACEAAGNTTRFTVNSSRYALPIYERFGFVAVSDEVNNDGVLYTPMEMKVG